MLRMVVGYALLTALVGGAIMFTMLQILRIVGLTRAALARALLVGRP